MIAVNLVGRIGNQLFIYAAAEAIRQKRGRNEKIVFYDESILNAGWKNSLLDYPLENVEYVHDKRKRPWIIKMQSFIVSRMFKFLQNKKHSEIRRIEQKMQPFLGRLGIMTSRYGENVSSKVPITSYVWMTGYFQSIQYFKNIAPKIHDTLTYRLPILREKKYVQQLEKRNSVCISIKVEHNANNPIWDVCDKSYYEKAIVYIIEHVENPLFFICSDNVQYVLEHYIDSNRYDCICQENGLPVSDALTIMSVCKNFVIGNTSFGRWATILSDNPDKIVVAPNRWFRDEDMQTNSIYEENPGWHLIDVSEYLNNTKNKYEQ